MVPFTAGAKVVSFVTVFACLGTWIVARHGFRRQRDD
jgi:hypothetical protein